MRVLVCGGRDFSDRDLLFRTLDDLRREQVVNVIIEGNASGADRLAGYWARKHHIKNKKFPADWEKNGKAAGPIRNARMIAEGKPDLVIAFPGGEGTANMIAQAKEAGIDVVEVS
jgi:hypothetical protein